MNSESRDDIWRFLSPINKLKHTGSGGTFENFGLNGLWTSIVHGGATRIVDDKLFWWHADDTSSRITEKDGVFAVIHPKWGEYTFTITSDRTLEWSDGDVWKDAEKGIRVSVSLFISCLCDASGIDKLVNLE